MDGTRRRGGSRPKRRPLGDSVSGKDGGLALAARDNGTGFETAREPQRASLGLASMRARVRLLGGRLDFESVRGDGTAVLTWVPLPEAA
jgi:signal transduction histidine kinase